MGPAAALLLAVALLPGALGPTSTDDSDGALEEILDPGLLPVAHRAPAQPTRMPAAFVPNLGQVQDADLRYLAHFSGWRATFHDQGFELLPAEGSASAGHAIAVSFAGARPVVPAPVESFGAVFTYIGPGAPQGRTSTASSEIVYRAPYPGIDIVFALGDSGLKYTLNVAAGASLDAFRLEFEGAKSIRLEPNGDLFVEGGSNDFVDAAPSAIDGDGRALACNYELIDSMGVGIACPGWDRRTPLTVDPLIYSSVIGGSDFDYVTDVLIADDGSIYVSGSVHSGDYPAAGGGYNNSTSDGSGNAFISHISANGSALLFTILIGGDWQDEATYLALGDDGTVYTAGRTSSSDFPTTPGAFRGTGSGANGTANQRFDVIVARFSADGTSVIFSAYVGGSRDDLAAGIGVDAAGAAYVVGTTHSPNFPNTTGAFDNSLAGNQDVFAFKMDANGSSLIYSTYLGGITQDYTGAMVLMDNGTVVITGSADSPDFPTTAGAYKTSNPDPADCFVTWLDPTGSTLIASTLIGSSLPDFCFDIDLDAQGNAWIVGFTQTADFPTTPGAFDRYFNGTYPSNASDGMVAAISADGARLLYGSYVGGSDSDRSNTVAVSPGGRVAIAGESDSSDNTLTGDAYQRTYHGNGDSYVVVLEPNGSALRYASYLGGSGPDYPRSLRWQGDDTLWLAGSTVSSDYPVLPGGISTSLAGVDGVLSAIRLDTSVNLTFETDPPGLSVSVNGSWQSAPFTVACGLGGSLSLDVPSLVPGNDTRLVFDRWSDGGAVNHTVACYLSQEIVASYRLEYRATFETDPPGRVLYIDGVPEVAPLAYWWPQNSTHRVVVDDPQVNGPSRFLFLGWEGGAPRNATLTAAGPIALRGAFAREYEVLLRPSMAGAFVFLDGVEVSRLAQFWLAEGTNHTLEAPTPQEHPATRYVFRGWAGGNLWGTPVNISMDRPWDIEGQFELERKISLDTSPTGLEILVNGTALATPAVAWVSDGASFSLEAPSTQFDVDTKYDFISWADAGGRSRTEVADAVRGFTASYSWSFRVVITTQPPGFSPRVDGAAVATPSSFWWAAGSQHEIAAPPTTEQGSVRYVFDNWSNGAPPSFTLVATGPLTVIANMGEEKRFTFVSEPGGAQVRLDGLAVQTPAALWWRAATTHSVEAFDQGPSAATRWGFASWSSGANQSGEIVVEEAMDLTVVFNVEHLVRFYTSPPGRNISVDGAELATPFSQWWAEGSDHGAVVPDSQMAGNIRYRFAAWADGGGRTRSLSVTGPTDFAATFLTEFRIRVETEPAGLPLVIDGNSTQSPFEAWWLNGSSHSIRAEALVDFNGSIWRLREWVGQVGTPEVVNASRPQTLSAIYDREGPSGGAQDGPVIVGVAVLALTVGVAAVVILGLRNRRRRPNPPPKESLK